jgi:hypothetical protein
MPSLIAAKEVISTHVFQIFHHMSIHIRHSETVILISTMPHALEIESVDTANKAPTHQCPYSESSSWPLHVSANSLPTSNPDTVQVRSLPDNSLAGMQNPSQHRESVPYHCATPLCNNIYLPENRPLAAASSNKFHQHLLLYQLSLSAVNGAIYLWWNWLDLSAKLLLNSVSVNHTSVLIKYWW